jgi:hypothetical protein
VGVQAKTNTDARRVAVDNLPAIRGFFNLLGIFSNAIIMNLY